MTDTIEYGQQRISYSVEYRDRTTLEIAVLPDGTVHVKAPLQTSVDKIKVRMLRRAGWILKQQRYFEQFSLKTPPRQYIGGETHLYLGRQYRLKLSLAEQNSIKLERGFIRISSPDLSPENIRKILEKYYRHRAKEKYREYLAVVAERFGLEMLPCLQIRSMKTNWGSMSPGGILSLNPELIKAPVQCLEYVITHELCHLQHRDHDAEFYTELNTRLPDWEKRKERLELALI